MRCTDNHIDGSMEKVKRDGKVAVLYSPGFGAGWFSWNTDHQELLFHPKLVELVELNQRHLITDELVRELLGAEIYTGGSDTLRIVWLDEGTAFNIDEYDGSESVVTMEHISLIA